MDKNLSFITVCTVQQAQSTIQNNATEVVKWAQNSFLGIYFMSCLHLNWLCKSS